MSRSKEVGSDLKSNLQLGEDIFDIASCPKCGRGGCLMVSRKGFRKKLVQEVHHGLDDICELDAWWDADSEMWVGCDPAKYFAGCKCSKCLSADRRNPFFSKEHTGTVDTGLSNRYT